MKLLNAEGQTAFAGFSAHVPEYVNIPNFSPQKNSRTDLLRGKLTGRPQKASGQQNMAGFQ